MPSRVREFSIRVLIWALASGVAIFVQLLWTPSSLVDGSYRPVGNDSFYHAQRIRSTVQDPAHFSEFDPRIDAPRGILVIWPWAYDTTVAAAVRAALATGISDDPMSAIVHAPVVAVVATTGLMVIIATLLGLSATGTLLAALCVALSPLTQVMHSIGVVDHHYAEFILILASLAAGLWWMGETAAVARAVCLAAVLGVAPAFHPALFLLQLPFLLTTGILWLRGSAIPRRAALVFAATLVTTTTVFLLPSEPFRQGLFEFHRFSWFQLYVAASTATLVATMSYVRPDSRGIGIFAGLSLILLFPVAGQLGAADRFLARDFAALASIHEAQSLPSILKTPGGALEISQLYSLFVWIAPLLLAGSLWALWTGTSARLTYYYVATIGGLAMLVAMFRFHGYGSFALYLTPLLWSETLTERAGLSSKLSRLVSVLVVILALAPSIRYLFVSNPGPGGEPYYAVTRDIYPVLDKACRRQPGIVLASNNDGHYVLFHSACSVIATNFLVTRQDEEALRKTDRLLAMTPKQFLATATPVRYILVRGQGMLAADERGVLSFVTAPVVAQSSPPLFSKLLLADPTLLGPRFQLIAEVRLPGPDGYAIARLFEVLPPQD